MVLPRRAFPQPRSGMGMDRAIIVGRLRYKRGSTKAGLRHRLQATETNIRLPYQIDSTAKTIMT